jgi:hypothetical protein
MCIMIHDFNAVCVLIVQTDVWKVQSVQAEGYFRWRVLGEGEVPADAMSRRR